MSLRSRAREAALSIKISANINGRGRVSQHFFLSNVLCPLTAAVAGLQAICRSTHLDGVVGRLWSRVARGGGGPEPSRKLPFCPPHRLRHFRREQLVRARGCTINSGGGCCCRGVIRLVLVLRRPIRYRTWLARPDCRKSRHSPCGWLCVKRVWSSQNHEEIFNLFKKASSEQLSQAVGERG